MADNLLSENGLVRTTCGSYNTTVAVVVFLSSLAA